ncbi:MAG: hypothetical protein MZV70_49020 [Desulfobacterales bacterium]|nr:hypothetical protein [Desulfobacterales bacterium]
MLLKELRLIQAASAKRMKGLAEAAAEAGRQAGEKGRGRRRRTKARRQRRKAAGPRQPGAKRAAPAREQAKTSEGRGKPGDAAGAGQESGRLGLGRHGGAAQQLHPESPMTTSSPASCERRPRRRRTPSSRPSCGRSMKSTRKAGPSRKLRLVAALAFLCCALLTVACATTRVGPTAILQAPQEIPEEQLLDVGIVVFSSEPMTAEKARKEGTHAEIRKAEQNFLPHHLKTTLQQSSQWGAVRVLPAETDSVDLLVKGTILESTGETLEVRIEARDAAGKVWLDKTYEAQAAAASYAALQPGEKDAFQDLYNRIANDLAEQRLKLSPQEAKALRTVSQLRFANRFRARGLRGLSKKGPATPSPSTGCRPKATP